MWRLGIAVRSVVLRMFHNLNKFKNYVPGFICLHHTFGRPLEWNPHMTDSVLLDMHYFLIEEDDLGDDEFEEGFYTGLF